MSSSEIARLERLWRENPQGYTFAPLAEAYRKLKDTDRALEVLADGLGRHPDYIPASIVLGRCQLDLGDDAAAEAAFVRVLELDGENVIALKALADIAERAGNHDASARHLRELLAVDRGNHDARAQLDRVEQALSDAALATPPPPARQDDEPAGAEPPVLDAPSAADDALVFDRIEAADVHDAGQVEPDESIQLQDHLQPPDDVEQLDDLLLEEAPALETEADEAETMEGLVGTGFAEQGREVEPMDDLRSGSAAHQPFGDIEAEDDLELTAAEENEFQLRSDADDLVAAMPGDEEPSWAPEASTAPSQEIELESRTADADLEIETVASSFGAESFQDAGSTLDDDADSADAGDDGSADLEPPEAFEPDDEGVPAMATAEPADAPADAPADDSDALDDAPEPELVVTESMAEVYLRQGHRAEALAVYRLLYQRRPDDLRLREKVDELETESAGDTGGRRAAPAPGQFLAADPAQSVAAMLGALFSAAPAAQPSAWEAGGGADTAPLEAPDREARAEASATRPADDHLSLSDVFGEERSPVPPAVGAQDAAEEAPSFDAFFGGEAAPAPARRARGDADLDQFHDWLQKLKS